MRLSILPVCVALASSALLACGSSSGGNGNGPGATDAGPTPTTDASTGAADAATAVDSGSDSGPPPEILADAGDNGSPSSTYPAFTVNAVQVVTGSQAVLKAPVVVTITWPGDTLADTFEAFGDKLGASTYWAAAVGEYGVGAVISGATNHVRLTEPVPATITPEDLAALVTANAGSATSDAGPAWPAPTDQTIYALYLPQGAQFTEQGQDICALGVGGYHDNVTTPGGKIVAYAVMPHCNDPSATPPVVFTDKDIEESASHEFAEAATDPFPDPNPVGYYGFDANHWDYAYFSGLQYELGDACEGFLSSFFQDTEASFPYWVQRIWSNKASTAGHNPCAPQLSAPYYNLTLFPSQEQDVTIDLTTAGDTTHTTKGFHALVGQSVTFQVGFFSDADTGGPWTISAEVPQYLPFPDSNYANITNGAAKVTIDKTSGQNGEKAYVTITPTTAGQIGSQLVVIKSALQADADATHPDHYLPILIANQ